MTNNIIPPQHSHLGLINTSSGKLIDLKNPSPDQICMKDIAHALSNICRFGGQAKPFYSVAQHSCLVAAIVPPKARKYALLHDAPEAYLGDVIKPLKNIIGEAYTILETRFEDVIIEKYGLFPQGGIAEIRESTKDADMIMLDMEHQALILGKPGMLAGFIVDNNLALVAG